MSTSVTLLAQKAKRPKSFSQIDCNLCGKKFVYIKRLIGHIGKEAECKKHYDINRIELPVARERKRRKVATNEESEATLEENDEEEKVDDGISEEENNDGDEMFEAGGDNILFDEEDQTLMNENGFKKESNLEEKEDGNAQTNIDEHQDGGTLTVEEEGWKEAGEEGALVGETGNDKEDDHEPDKMFSENVTKDEDDQHIITNDKSLQFKNGKPYYPVHLRVKIVRSIEKKVFKNIEALDAICQLSKELNIDPGMIADMWKRRGRYFALDEQRKANLKTLKPGTKVDEELLESGEEMPNREKEEETVDESGFNAQHFQNTEDEASHKEAGEVQCSGNEKNAEKKKHEKTTEEDKCELTSKEDKHEEDTEDQYEEDKNEETTEVDKHEENTEDKYVENNEESKYEKRTAVGVLIGEIKENENTGNNYLGETNEILQNPEYIANNEEELVIPAKEVRRVKTKCGICEACVKIEDCDSCRWHHLITMIFLSVCIFGSGWFGLCIFKAQLDLETIPIFFTGPRCLWGPVYGSRCLSVTPYKSFLKLC